MADPAITALIKELRRCAGWEDPQGAIAAAKGLAALHSDEVVPALIELLLHLDTIDLEDDAGDGIDEVVSTRLAIIRGLECCEGRALLPLREVVAKGPTGAGLAALQVLAKLPDAETAPLAISWVQQGIREAILPLGILNPPGATGVLSAAILAAPELNRGWTKRLAGQALGWIGDDAALAALEVLLDDEDWFARVGAVEGLLRVPTERARAALRRAAADVDPRVARAAVS